MHKGRFYRRILPQVMSPNCFDRFTAPVGLWTRVGIVYAGTRLFQQTKQKNEQLFVNIKTAEMEWRWSFSFGIFNFAAGLNMHLNEHDPNMQFSFLVIDEVGGDLACEWRMPPFTYGFPTYGFFFPAIPNKVHLGGQFDGFLMLEVQPITYHEEP